MKKAAQEHAAEDKSRRDEVETRNQADNLVFQSKKQLQEFGDKIPADKKKALEEAIQKLEASAKTAPIAQLKTEIEALNKVWGEAATYMYQQQAQPGQQEPGAGPQQGPQQEQAEPKAQSAENADYEIIDDKDKK
jgi:molecular chaperone DnaK